MRDEDPKLLLLKFRLTMEDYYDALFYRTHFQQTNHFIKYFCQKKLVSPSRLPCLLYYEHFFKEFVVAMSQKYPKVDFKKPFVLFEDV